MSSKPRLLCWSDFGGCNTGFNRVATALYDKLHEDFEVNVLAINYHGLNEFDTSKYAMVFPIDNTDPFGYNRLPLILQRVKPDVIFLFQDIFNVIPAARIARQALGPDIPIVTYYPVDGAPVSASWRSAYQPGLFQKHITYSDWAVDEIKSTFPEETKDMDIDVMYHGVDPNVFYPLKPFHIKQVKRERGWHDKFTVINLNRFQPRKGIDRTIDAFAMFHYGYFIDKDGYWFPRTMKRHPLQHYNMSDPGVIVDEVPGHEDTVMYLHSSPADRIFGPTKSCSLFAQAYNRGIKNDDLGTVFQVPMRDIMAMPSPDSEINEMYNAADINITGTLGEGCGLSLVEASACGTTSIAPHNSAIPEMLEDTGHLCKNVSTFLQSMDNAHCRPLVDPRELVKAMEIEYQRWIANGRKKLFNQPAVDLVKRKFQWDDKKSFLRDILLETLKGGK